MRAAVLFFRPASCEKIRGPVESDAERANRTAACLAQAADENGLPDYYRDCVKPLLRLPESGWPRCCGGSCEPCSETLRRVARRTLDLLETAKG